MAEASEIHAGTVLGETYEITELLGQGGMGAVWAAKHLRLPGKRVAIKVLHGLAASDRESYARFRREAEIASRIGHPNIVTVHDFNVLPSGTPYLVLEYLEGEDLAHRLVRGKIPLPAALAIARQIGSALHAAHKADVVHRDLKPGNVFLVPTEIGGELVDQVKVLDFGISKIRGSQTVQTQDSVLLGTPQYMAPEQALGKNTEIDARTDVFALGAIVYEMLSGRPAFLGDTLAEVVFKVVYDKQPPLAELAPELPKNVVDAVEQALAKDRQPALLRRGGVHQRADRAAAADARSRARAQSGARGVRLDAGGGGADADDGRARRADTGDPADDGGEGIADGKKAAFIAGAILAAIGGTVGVMKLTAKPPAEAPPVVATLPPKVETPVAPPNVETAVVPPKVVAPPPSATGATVAPKVVLQSAKLVAPSKKEALPPEVAAELDAAER